MAEGPGPRLGVQAVKRRREVSCSAILLVWPSESPNQRSQRQFATALHRFSWCGFLIEALLDLVFKRTSKLLVFRDTFRICGSGVADFGNSGKSLRGKFATAKSFHKSKRKRRERTRGHSGCRYYFRALSFYLMCAGFRMAIWQLVCKPTTARFPTSQARAWHVKIVSTAASGSLFRLYRVSRGLSRTLAAATPGSQTATTLLAMYRLYFVLGFQDLQLKVRLPAPFRPTVTKRRRVCIMSGM